MDKGRATRRQTYVVLAGKLDERRVLLAEHNFHSEDVAEAPKEREEPVGCLVGAQSRCGAAEAGRRTEQHVHNGTISMPHTERGANVRRGGEHEGMQRAFTASTRSMLLQMSTGDGGMSLRMVRPVWRTGTPPVTGRESRERSLEGGRLLP